MSVKDFNLQDAELQAMINDYRRQCWDAEAQIAINNREITLLEQKRVELRQQYIQEESL